jgi:hypothetical protein
MAHHPRRRLEIGSSSFLKKRTKKLLRMGAALVGPPRLYTNKSFLLLFFKKEVLSFLRFGGLKSSPPYGTATR